MGEIEVGWSDGGDGNGGGGGGGGGVSKMIGSED